MKNKSKAPLIILLTIIFLATATFGYLFFVRLSSAGFDAGQMLTLTKSGDRYVLSWADQGEKSNDGYIVEVYDRSGTGGDDEEPVYSVTYPREDLVNGLLKIHEGDCSLTLPGDIKPDRPLTLYVNTVRIINVFGRDIIKRGKAPIREDFNIDSLWEGSLDYKVDVASGEISFECSALNNGEYKLYLKKDASGVAVNASGGEDFDAQETDTDKENIPDIKTDAADGQVIPADVSVDNGKVTLKGRFGKDGFEIPAQGERYTFVVSCTGVSDRLVLNYENVILDREEFLTDKVTVTSEDDGKNRYILSWNETKGEGYTVSLYDENIGSWNELRTYSLDDERIFETGKLRPGKDYTYKIEAVHAPAEVSKEDSVNEFHIHTYPCIEYATVWPTKDMPVYKNSTGDDQAGTIGVLKAVTVLDEKDGRFLINTGKGNDSLEGYIDSNCVMVNLPDYIGDLCKYDITNSYSSIYLAHDYGIPAVSGTVVSGYENVLLGDGTFLVPLLYPVANKLIPAAENAREEGYIIKIYDSFRPYVATRSIYDLSYAALDYVVPGYTFNRISLQDYENGNRAEVISLSSLKKAEKATEEEEDKDSKKDKKSKKKKKTTEAAKTSNETTYADVMLNNGAYNLGAFLAASGSMHNLGIAMDMTIENADTGEELSMQSAMHDLSFHSIQASNNDNANILKRIMEAQGFAMITSEWWHFQDNDVRNTLNPVSVQNGVSIEGWKKDDKGWRYFMSDGSYYKGETATIGEDTYSFDNDGYVE